MPKQKYDYASLKAEFMKSDIDEVQVFLRWKFGDKIAKSSMKNQCEWWTKEKKAMKQKITEKAIEKTIQKQAEELSAKIPMDRLIRMKTDFFDLIEAAIQWMQWKDNVDIDKVIKWLNAIKTELWEPTSVNKNDNTNINKDSITIEDKELIDNYFKQKQNGWTPNQ